MEFYNSDGGTSGACGNGTRCVAYLLSKEMNKDKKIIAKSISISQLEEMIDRLQGKEDLPKLFPPDPEEDAQMQKKE